MIENRDIHSYNCNVFIINKAHLYEVNVVNGLEITFERKGSPGKCTFSIVQEEDGKVEFEEGDEVSVKISQTWMFKGYIFSKSRNKDGEIKFTCYDQLRYLKAEEAVVIENMTVGEITKDIIKSRQLKAGTIRDSSFKIPAIVRDKISFLDLIQLSIESTTAETGEHFIFYDRFGKLTLCPLKHMRRNVVIDSSVAEDFDYESSIDKDTYNIIRVSSSSAKDGATVYVTARDKDNINKWGMLQKTLEADNGWSATTISNRALDLFNSKTKTLKLTNCMGAVEVIGGAVIIVNLDLGDMVVSKNMIVDAVTHRVEDGLYSMDLELVGGEFISTRGGQGEPGEKEKYNEKEEELISSNVNGNLEPWNGNLEPWNGITLEMINSQLKGTYLEGHGETVLKCAHGYNFNPLVMISIWKVESYPTIDSGLAKKGNNFGGMTWASSNKYPYIIMGRKYVKCPTKDDGIEENFRLVGVTYVYKWGKRTLNEIMYIYSPPHENQTAKYLNTLKNNYKNITGKAWSDSYLGGGVSSQEEAKNKMKANESKKNSTVTGGGSSGGGTNLGKPSGSMGFDGANSTPQQFIERAIHFCQSYVNTPYSQDYRNSWATSGGHATYFDCSALVYYAYAYAGKLKKKPANAWTTYTVSGSPGSYGLYWVPLSKAKRGDVLWMSGHLGLYLGNGKSAESGGEKNGSRVHMNGRAGRFSCAYRFKGF